MSAYHTLLFSARKDVALLRFRLSALLPASTHEYILSRRMEKTYTAARLRNHPSAAARIPTPRQIDKHLFSLLTRRAWQHDPPRILTDPHRIIAFTAPGIHKQTRRNKSVRKSQQCIGGWLVISPIQKSSPRPYGVGRIAGHRSVTAHKSQIHISARAPVKAMTLSVILAFAHVCPCLLAKRCSAYRANKYIPWEAVLFSLSFQFSPTLHDRRIFRSDSD